METSKFKVGDIVVLSPVGQTKEYIENDIRKVYQKYVGERGEIISTNYTLETAEVRFFNTNLPGIYYWYFKDLIRAGENSKKTEVSGEV